MAFTDIFGQEQPIRFLQKALVSQRLAQSRLEGQIQQTNISILSPAEPPLRPSSPSLLLNALIGIALGTLLGAGAALENLLPVIPADTFVVLGGFLAAQGRAAPIGVFLATWGGNVIVALLVYRAAWHYGPAFFTGGMGQRLLKPRQLQRLAIFYRRWGPWAIFLTRFLPGFRAVVPVFAGVTHQPLLPVAIPLAVFIHLSFKRLRDGVIRRGVAPGGSPRPENSRIAM